MLLSISIKEYNIEAENAVYRILYSSRPTRLQYIEYCTLLDQPDCSISNTVLFLTNQIANILYIRRNKQYYKSKPLLTVRAIEASFGPRICFMPLCNMSEIFTCLFHVTGLFPYPLKTAESHRFFDVFRVIDRNGSRRSVFSVLSELMTHPLTGVSSQQKLIVTTVS